MSTTPLEMAVAYIADLWDDCPADVYRDSSDNTKSGAAITACVQGRDHDRECKGDMAACWRAFFEALAGMEQNEKGAA